MFGRCSAHAPRRLQTAVQRQTCRAQAGQAARATGVVDAAQFEQFALELQASIIRDAEALEGRLVSARQRTEAPETFHIDRWERDAAGGNGGYGITAVLEGGEVLEKAAANVSVVRGVLSPQRAQAMSSRGREEVDPAGGQQYSAVAMSLVFHSAHPHIPTLRADVRMFEVEGVAWFGGGCDLTPNYLRHQTDPEAPSTDLRDDITEFHAFWKETCDCHSGDLYARYKTWCDEYFYIPCRKEHRGTGGLFFDDLEAGAAGFDAMAFTEAVGRGILPSWLPIVERRVHLPFDEAHRTWQQLRRGRYIEFNLLYDRGVKFGLDGGRIESIMVSAPPLVRWQYMKSVEPGMGTPEQEMLDVLRAPVAWA